MSSWVRALVFFSAVIAAPAVLAQSAATRGVIVDQTGLPLPGATVQLRDGDTITATATTRADGSFEFDPALSGAMVAAALDGFETTVVPRSAAAHIVLPLAHATETTTVVAPAFVERQPRRNWARTSRRKRLRAYHRRG